ncbi:MAG: hypothetical protein HY560_08770 [Gemmatimonadetes bacterium]|nr:hypothetical protein [Gemmatimonadota bacterium]
MNPVLMLLLGAVLLVLPWLVISSLAAAASPAGGRPRLKAVIARLVCPETGAPAQVRLGVLGVDGDAVPDVLNCERFPSGAISCDRACLERADRIGPPEPAPALA